jgi:two-component system response regulator HydG
MKASDLKLEELVEFSEGHVNLHGRRLVVHDLRAFAHLRKELIELAGPNDARRVLTRFGFLWGQVDAAAMKRLFEWDDVTELLRAGSRLHALQGVARTSIQTLEVDEKTGRFDMTLIWHDSGEAEEHLTEIGPTDSPVCWMLAGYASGYATFCMGRDIYFIEKTCKAQGDLACMALGRDKESWGEELTPYLPYFDPAHEMVDKVKELTDMLRQKDRELAQQRRQLLLLERRAKVLPVEVHSASYARVLEMANRVAPFDTSVLITGESGVGKEVLARQIHKMSGRAEGPFVAVNCGALPETLLEGELFGYRAGAFTGATRDRVGIFEEAQKGTILLDEIGDTSPSTQLKLLRVLQEREIVRLGENKPRKIDVRLIAATHRAIPQMVKEGTFREDLFYRLAVVEIRIPPLRERREDILPLARHFIQKMARKLKLSPLRLDATCLNYLQNYSWPGNIRELENAIERAAVFSLDGLIVPEYLPPAIVHDPAVRARASDSPLRSLQDMENEHIRAVLELSGNNRARAASILGISAATLWRKLKAMGRDGGMN